MSYESIGKGIVKRTERRVIGLFIDGTSLDRASRRINRKVDLAGLVRGVTSGVPPTVARYYTLVPNEDDSRQRAFLDAVSRAGLDVIIKRLPPKGVNRQVSTDIEMAADIVAFSLGLNEFTPINQYLPESQRLPQDIYEQSVADQQSSDAEQQTASKAMSAVINAEDLAKVKRVVTVVCPSRDIAYPISLVKTLSVDTVTADFGQFKSGDLLKSASKWIDLSNSETIWRP